MATPNPRLERLAEVRLFVEGFDTPKRPQKQLRQLLLEMLREMELSFSRPGKREVLEMWWAAVDVYLQLLQSPLLAAPGGAKLLRETLDLTWAQLKKPAQVRRVSGRAVRLLRARGRQGSRRGRSGRRTSERLDRRVG